MVAIYHPQTATSRYPNPLTAKIADLSRRGSRLVLSCCMSMDSVLGRTSRIRRRRAQDVADTTDSLQAVACIRFVRPWLVVIVHSLGGLCVIHNYFGVTVRCPDAKRPSSAGLVIVQRTSRPIGPAAPNVITGLCMATFLISLTLTVASVVVVISMVRTNRGST